jgi:hypothetical protein
VKRNPTTLSTFKLLVVIPFIVQVAPCQEVELKVIPGDPFSDLEARKSFPADSSKDKTPKSTKPLKELLGGELPTLSVSKAELLVEGEIRPLHEFADDLSSDPVDRAALRRSLY